MNEIKILDNKCPSRVIVAAVSYLNTVPFIWGIKQAAPSLRENLSLAIPATCAQLFNSNKADIALIPVGALSPTFQNRIITDFCISADSFVDSVVLLANCPMTEIKTIYLDSHSRTSVQLAQILAREKWSISPQWINGIPTEIAPHEAVVAIGDKVFDIQNMFSHKWDLAYEWVQLTGMPFVFAVWVAHQHVPQSVIDELNNALLIGTQNIDKAIENYITTCADPKKYLTENIKYDLTFTKRESLKLFWEKQITPG